MSVLGPALTLDLPPFTSGADCEDDHGQENADDDRDHRSYVERVERHDALFSRNPSTTTRVDQDATTQYSQCQAEKSSTRPGFRSGKGAPMSCVVRTVVCNYKRHLISRIDEDDP